MRKVSLMNRHVFQIFYSEFILFSNERSMKIGKKELQGVINVQTWIAMVVTT